MKIIRNRQILTQMRKLKNVFIYTPPQAKRRSETSEEVNESISLYVF